MCSRCAVAPGSDRAEPISTSILIAVAATFFLAGIVKGVTGMGLPTLAMGVLGAMLSPLAAAGLLIVPSFVTNVWQLLAGPRFGGLLRRLWPMMLAILLGTFAGSSFLTGGRSEMATMLLGGTLAFYAAYTLLTRQLRVSLRFERWLSPSAGLVTGLVTGATGVFVIPAVPYLQALELERDDLVQALGLSFTVSTIALAAALALRGAWRSEDLLPSALAVLPALVGMGVGQALRARLRPERFRRWFLICLLMLGLEMTVRPLV